MPTLESVVMILLTPVKYIVYCCEVLLTWLDVGSETFEAMRLSTSGLKVFPPQRF